MILDFENKIAKQQVQKSFFTALLKRGLQILERDTKGGTIHLTIVTDQEIAELNKMYRGKNSPTDVLSFSYLEEKGFPGENLIGEIAISLETARKQAKEHQKTLKQELQFLFVHGLLHIFGYDHEKTADRKEMFDLQDEILGTKMWREIID
jgi:probable rRNA maturation factor